jgi:hypothetical protein
MQARFGLDDVREVTRAVRLCQRGLGNLVLLLSASESVTVAVLLTLATWFHDVDIDD